MMIPGTVYRIIRPIGQGGMGEVYEVEHDMLGARRALKVLMKHYAGREDLEERLRVEARGLARLKHPNLVEVYDLGTATDGRIFFAMELLDGVTLREMLRHRGRLSVRASVELTAQVLDGLHAAHLAGILHRDVKPENVFVCRGGTVKVLDFGVAKAIDAWMPDHQITGAGMTVGTPRYMAPEQAEGGAVDARTDVYAAGQMVWEMLVGRAAFDETDPYDIAHAKRVRGITPLSKVVGVDVPLALSSAVDRACQIDLANRFPTAAAFSNALRGSIGSPPIEVPTPGGATSSVAGLTTTTKSFGSTRPGPSDPPHVAQDGLSTAMVTGEVQRELTERIESIREVDRDAPTTAQAVGPRAVGPSGTELLPAVAARRSQPQPETVEARRSPPAAQLDARRSTRPAPPPRRGLLGVPLTGWLAGAAAFIIPVLCASAIAYWRLSSTKHAEPVEASTSATLSNASAIAPWVTADASPALTDGGEDSLVPADAEPASSGPPRTRPLVVATAPPRVATAQPGPTSKPPPVSTQTKAPPAPTPTKKMPSSGL